MGELNRALERGGGFHPPCHSLIPFFGMADEIRRHVTPISHHSSRHLVRVG